MVPGEGLVALVIFGFGVGLNDTRACAGHSCSQRKLFFFYCGEGPRSRSYGRAAVLRLIVQPCDEYEAKDDQFFFSFFKYWSTGGMKLTGENPAPVSLCPPRIPLELTPASNPGLRKKAVTRSCLWRSKELRLMCSAVIMFVRCESNGELRWDCTFTYRGGLLRDSEWKTGYGQAAKPIPYLISSRVFVSAPHHK
jgi:hypothetical protein